MRGPTKPPDTPNLPELQRSRDRFVLRNEFRPSRQSSLSSKRIRKARTFDIAGDAGRGFVMLRTWQFYVLWLLYFLGTSVGLTAIGESTPLIQPEFRNSAL